MGMVRFLLALVVVVSHVDHTGRLALFGNARIAVQVFFIISGFLISFVLNRGTTYDNPFRFYFNRALRIYPVYWITALLTLSGALFVSTKPHEFMGLALPTKALLTAANLLLFGQDWVMFLQQKGGGLTPARDFWQTDPQLWTFLLIPPAWSLGVELTFYLLAPFIVRRVPFSISLTLLSLGATLVGWYYGLAQDPWTYRFFPFELSLFLLGGLSERLLLPRSTALPRAALIAAPPLAILLLMIAPLLPNVEPFNTIVLIAAVLGLMPLLFRFQHGRRWDTKIGDLSYPLYICHYPLVQLVELQIGTTGKLHAALGIGLPIIAAMGLERFVTEPIETLRRQIRRTAALSPSSGPGHPALVQAPIGERA